jgi:predicted RNA-binding Zn-ribbon protein involved in translation (DUF1610 family)
MKTCEQCGEEFWPREAKVRFCCPECNQAWWSAERSRAWAAWRQRRQEEQAEWPHKEASA